MSTQVLIHGTYPNYLQVKNPNFAKNAAPTPETIRKLHDELVCGE
jgi:hypothetical protein